MQGGGFVLDGGYHRLQLLLHDVDGTGQNAEFVIHEDGKGAAAEVPFGDCARAAAQRVEGSQQAEGCKSESSESDAAAHDGAGPDCRNLKFTEGQDLGKAGEGGGQAEKPGDQEQLGAAWNAAKEIHLWLSWRAMGMVAGGEAEPAESRAAASAAASADE